MLISLFRAWCHLDDVVHESECIIGSVLPLLPERLVLLLLKGQDGHPILLQYVFTCVCVCFARVCVQGCVRPLVSGRRLNNSQGSHAQRQRALHPLCSTCVCFECVREGGKDACVHGCVRKRVCTYACMCLWVCEPRSVSGDIVLHNP